MTAMEDSGDQIRRPCGTIGRGNRGETERREWASKGRARGGECGFTRAPSRREINRGETAVVVDLEDDDVIMTSSFPFSFSFIFCFLL